ncbi:MAG: T9SS type A sorting domain-containing protein [Bacteroidota bacterium]
MTTTDPVRFENYGAVTGTGRLTFIRRPSHVINDGRIESGDLELNRATMTLDGSGEISSGMTGFLATLLFGDASAALTTSTAPLQLFEGSTLGGTIPAGVTVEAVRSTDNTNDEIDLRTGFRIGGQFILNSVQVEGGWINDGLLSVVGSSTFLDGTSPSYENNGEVRISGNRTLNVRAGPGSMTPFRNTSTGILSGGGELDIDDGDLVVTNEGRIVPGPLSNVLTISGGIAIPRLDVEVGPAGETNRVDVIGTATLSGLLTITLQSGGALPSGAVTFVTCSAGCTGTFDQIEVTGDAQYAATATYEANAITVEVTEVDPIPPPVLSLSAQTLADDGLQDTDPVGLWPDQSGNGLDAFAPKNRRRPLLRTAVSAFNGQDGVFFNEKRDLRVPPSDSLIDLGPYREKTTALVFRTADVDTRQVLYEQGSDERGQVAYVYQDTLWVGAWNLRGTLWGPLWLSTPISERTVYTLTFSLDANAGQFAAWLNGTSIGSLSGADLLQRARGDGSGLGATTGTTQYEDTGASSAKARMRGFLLEVRQYNAVLSTSARESLEGAFMTTYGISAGARRGVATASSAAPSSAVRSGGTTAVEAMRASASAAPPGGVIDASRTTVAAYPNPFSGAAQIHYHLHRAGEVRVEVYSVLGQRVSVLHDGWLDSGWHQRTLGGRHLPSGLYLVQVTTETDVTTYRITRAR